MKVYCTYQTEEARWNSEMMRAEPTGNLCDALGSDATIRIDGRLGAQSMVAVAEREMTRRLKAYEGFRIYKCERLDHNEHTIFSSRAT